MLLHLHIQRKQEKAASPHTVAYSSWVKKAIAETVNFFWDYIVVFELYGVVQESQLPLVLNEIYKM